MKTHLPAIGLLLALSTAVISLLAGSATDVSDQDESACQGCDAHDWR